jgi:glycerol-3-phosphate dehydrogenase subunit B
VSLGRAYDVVVVGAGVAGLCAAVRAAQAGARVLVLAKGVGATHLAPATVDVLGYAPERVERPAEALEAFAAAHPEHPYARLPAGSVAAGVGWLKTLFEDGAADGYRYRGGLDRNLVLPTPVGAPKPSAVVPETMAGGDLRGGGPICVVGLRRLKDFYAPYLADNLSRLEGVSARAIELSREVEGRAEANALAFARRFDDPGFRAGVAGELAARVEDGERVALPAVLGLRDAHAAWSELEARLGRPVFEVPTLPPSVPGMRLQGALRGALRRAGGRVIVGSEAVGADTEPGRVVRVRARAAAREASYATRFLVLASGGFGAGGLELDSSWRAREAVLGLPLAGMPGPGEPRFGPELLGPQPLARAGVAVDDGLRPVAAGGGRVYDNVLVAGATLAGAEPWREKSGDGVSVATGHRAGELIAEEG